MGSFQDKECACAFNNSSCKTIALYERATKLLSLLLCAHTSWPAGLAHMVPLSIVQLRAMCMHPVHMDLASKLDLVLVVLGSLPRHANLANRVSMTLCTKGFALYYYHYAYEQQEVPGRELSLMIDCGKANQGIYNKI